MAPKILMVLSSHNKIDSLENHPTGWYLAEFAHPYWALSPTCTIVVASPQGGEAPLDPSSIEAAKDDELGQRFLREKSELWKNTTKLEDFLGKAADFDAIFFVGGHGPMFDLATDKVSQNLIAEFYESNKVVSAVCHGPAALVNVKLSDGTYLVKGQKTTCFSNKEEDQVGLSSAMPFMLETELKKRSGDESLFEAAEPWAEKVVVSGKGGRLITGQNPASAGGVGEAVLRAVGVGG